MSFTGNTIPPSITLSAFKDGISGGTRADGVSTSTGFYYIPFGPVVIWFGTGGAPDFDALTIGDLALDQATGIWYSATNITGTWGVLNNA